MVAGTRPNLVTQDQEQLAWDEWPDYPGRNIGIDLVALMVDGSLCAVQAKCFERLMVHLIVVICFGPGSMMWKRESNCESCLLTKP